MKKPHILPLVIVLLLIVILLGGCTSSQSTATEAVPTLASPSEEPTLMSTPSEPLPTEIQPTAEIGPVTGPIPLVNPGFEEQAADGTLPGWTHSGAAGAILIEDNGHSSDFRLTQTSTAVYQVETSQTITGLANGPGIRCAPGCAPAAGKKKSTWRSSAGTRKSEPMCRRPHRATVGCSWLSPTR